MFSVSQMASADPPSTSKPTVRRARPVHSCLDCRNRKLKCDRARPCGQCAKAGRAADCHYDSHAGSMSRAQENGESEPSSKRRRTENGDYDGVAYGAYNSYASPMGSQTHGYGSVMDASPRAGEHGLQPQPSQAVQGPAGTQRAIENTDANIAPQLRGAERVGVIEDLQTRVSWLEKLLKVERDDEESQSTKTGAAEVLVDLRHSHSSAMNPKRSIIHQFEDMRAFYLKTIDASNGLDEIHRLRTIFPKSKQPTRKYVGSSAAMSGILELIPPSGDCDRLVKVYLNTWDPIYQILDLSHFLDAYARFWRQTSEEHRTAFAPALLLVVAIGSALDDTSQSQYPTLLNESISYVETWLADLSNKRQKDLEVLCAHALLVIAMQCAAIIPERIYRTTGSLARSAMLMGLHYDPRVVQHKADERHIQHRRKLWTSIVELDLQASLQVGIPPAVRDTDLRESATVLANDPSHYDNSSIKPVASSSTSKPQQQPTPDDTHSSLQHSLAKTLKTRLVTGALTLDVYPTHNFAAMREKVHVPLSGNCFPTIIADLHIQRSILAITRAQIKAQGHRVLEGCLASARAAMTTLRHMDSLDPGLHLNLGTKAPWNLYVTLFSNDIYRAALVLCLIRRLASSFPPYTGAIGEYSPRALLAAAENCLQRLLAQLDDPGNHVRDLIALTLALESVRPEHQKDDTTKAAAMRAGFEHLKQRLYERKGGEAARGVVGTSPATGSASSATPLDMGEFDLGFLASSFNFDLDFGFGVAGYDAPWQQMQAVDFGVPNVMAAGVAGEGGGGGGGGGMSVQGL